MLTWLVLAVAEPSCWRTCKRVVEQSKKTRTYRKNEVRHQCIWASNSGKSGWDSETTNTSLMMLNKSVEMYKFGCWPVQHWFTKAPVFWHNTEHSWNWFTITNLLHTAYPTWEQRSCLAAHGYIWCRFTFCWWWLKCLRKASTYIVEQALEHKNPTNQYISRNSGVETFVS